VKRKMMQSQLNLKPQAPRKYWNALLSWGQLKKQLLKGKMHLRNTFGDEIRIKETFNVYEGDKLLFTTRGHIVGGNTGSNSYTYNGTTFYTQGSGLAFIANLITCNYTTNGTYSPQGFSYQWRHQVGTGSGTTSPGTSALSAIVSTAANSSSLSWSNPSSGVYRITWTSTWNAGTLSAITISELGLFNNIGLCSRISSSDGDFTAFQVNVSAPLTAAQTLTLSFA
jgi:hypothetical protein